MYVYMHTHIDFFISPVHIYERLYIYMLIYLERYIYVYVDISVFIHI